MQPRARPPARPPPAWSGLWPPSPAAYLAPRDSVPGGDGARENGGESGERIGAQAREKAERVAGKVQERMGDVRGQMQDRIEDIRGYGEDAGQWIRDFARERPLAAIGIAVGIGFVLGRLLSRA